LRRIRKVILGLVAGFVVALGVLANVPARSMGLDRAFAGSLLGPRRAMGVVVWSHGRSIDSEDWKSPTPAYLRVVRRAGWDVMRFDRRRDNDTLQRSARRLVALAADLKHEGYPRVVLAGQSFGAFLSLMAADASSDVDAVVATAPAAYGDFQDFYDSWRLNATRLYPLLERIKSAHVMLFYFHDDDFDPGGRGARSREILGARKLGFAVVDQPAYLTGHWASSTGLFVRRFGPCIRDFIADDRLKGEMVCDPTWGQQPSAQLRLPDDLIDDLIHPAAAPAAVVANGASRPGAARAETAEAWYGFYPNGREVLVAIDRRHRGSVSAVYAIGPGLDRGEPAAWTRRKGRVVAGELVFAAKGKSTLRLRRSDNGRLDATWTAPDGGDSMAASLRPIDLARHFGRRTAAR
jgi:hypothetical protein